MFLDFHQMILNNKRMQLPLFKKVSLNSENFEKYILTLGPDTNLRNPVLIDLDALTHEEQTLFFELLLPSITSKKLSFHFPYPIFIKTLLEFNSPDLLLIKNDSELPLFYQRKESKMNLKETQILMKNKLLQQEIKNSDIGVLLDQVDSYAKDHRKVYEKEVERLAYMSILGKLKKLDKK